MRLFFSFVVFHIFGMCASSRESFLPSRSLNRPQQRNSYCVGGGFSRRKRAKWRCIRFTSSYHLKKVLSTSLNQMLFSQALHRFNRSILVNVQDCQALQCFLACPDWAHCIARSNGAATRTASLCWFSFSRCNYLGCIQYSCYNVDIFFCECCLTFSNRVLRFKYAACSLRFIAMPGGCNRSVIENTQHRHLDKH